MWYYLLRIQLDVLCTGFLTILLEDLIMIKQKNILLSLAMGILVAAPTAQAWTQVSHDLRMTTSGASLTSTAMGFPVFPVTIRNFVNVASSDKPNIRDEYGADRIVLYPGHWYNISFIDDNNAGRGIGYSNTTVFTASGIAGSMGTMIDTSNFAPNESEQDYQSRLFF